VLGRVKTSAISGIDATAVEVEVQVSSGKPNFNIIGLADNAVRESRDRVMAALSRAGFFLPRRILVNLAPAEIKKEGSSFDLAIALGILRASEQIESKELTNATFHGELSLAGGVKPVRGIIALALQAARDGTRTIVVPKENANEAALVRELDVVGVDSLGELVGLLREGKLHGARSLASTPQTVTQDKKKLSDVRGQRGAKRALLIAACAGHNLLMIGPPGCGKSMLAERFVSLLPPLSREEILEVARIHSVAGYALGSILSGERPFRSPHHVISDAGLMGGGSVPRPGEVSLSHLGVLFLDEFPEFRRSALESLRSPLECGEVTISRAKASLKYPARFQLIAAMNPCPCGRLGAEGQTCNCSSVLIQKYLCKLSGPILDRIDFHIELDAVPFEKISSAQSQSDDLPDLELRNIVLKTRKLQLERQGSLNSLLPSEVITKSIALDSKCLRLLELASKNSAISARAYFKIIRVARTIADIEGAQKVDSAHIAEAISLRGLERLRKYL